MNDNLTLFTASPDITVRDALKKIDENKKGFLIVVDDYDAVLGTLTDGDVRRAFLKGASADDGIEGLYTRNSKCLKQSNGIHKATEMFKNESIKFLPIVDEENRLLNIITKNQMHALLLQDIHADLQYDFMSLDEGIVDYEIFHRPWDSTKLR